MCSSDLKDRGVVWALHRAALAAQFDHVLVMRDGRVSEQGEFAELKEQSGDLKDLLDAD